MRAPFRDGACVDIRRRRRSNFIVFPSRSRLPMLRLCVFSVILASLLLTSCGQVFVSAFSHPGSSTVFIGTVSIVQITVIDGNVLVTFVTLINGGIGNGFTFCGDQRNQFPMNQLVSATFTPGTPCANIIQVSGM